MSLALVVVGAGFGLGGLILGIYNGGSCPAISLGEPPGCDHQGTLFGATFWIGASSIELEMVGAYVLGTGLVVYLASRSASRRPM
ncbi:MAG: hypothetical protein KGI38_02270 [Thaumarchaeota archaeon]|nr:hypothetical protein [Nitrososphaerota archaeon]